MEKEKPRRTSLQLDVLKHKAGIKEKGSNKYPREGEEIGLKTAIMKSASSIPRKPWFFREKRGEGKKGAHEIHYLAAS